MKKEGIVALLSLILVLSSVSYSLALSEQYDLIYDDNGNIISGFGFNYTTGQTEISDVREGRTLDVHLRIKLAMEMFE